MSKPAFAVMSRALQRELAAACRRRLPNETCGILYGFQSEDQVTADGFTVIRNAARHPGLSFSFAPEDWIPAYYEAQKNQRAIVGFFHSHPSGSPLPSAQDAKGWLPWGTYWIVGFTEQDCRIAVYGCEPHNAWRQLALNDG